MTEQRFIKIHVLADELGNIIFGINQSRASWRQLQAEIYIFNRLAELIFDRIRMALITNKSVVPSKWLQKILTEIDDNRLTERPSL